MLHDLPFHMLRCGLALAIIGPLPAAAAAKGGYTAEYTGYSHGFVVLKLAATLLLGESNYSVHVTFHTAGLAGLVVRADNDSSATGTFRGAQAWPSLFEASGHLRGSSRLTRMRFTDGTPVVLALSPPVEGERSIVTPAQSAHTMDTLSALALLVRQVGQTGQCDGSVETFDGRRLGMQTARTAGHDWLGPSERSIYAGQVLRCDVEGRQIGGFVHSENEADLRRPRHGTAWLADMVPGAPPVPVRVAFDNKILGQVTLYLTKAAPAG